MVAELDRQAEGGGGGPRVGLVAVALPFSGGSFELQLPPPVTMVAAGVAAGLSFVQQRAAGGLLGAPGRCFPPANQQQFASSSPAASSVITRRGRDKVKRALRAVTASDWKSTVLGAVELTGLLASAGQLMSPKGPGGSDRSVCDKCANVATSLPYVVCGCHAMRYRQNAAGKAWGASLCGVGAASAVFHGSWGSVRCWGRKADYWSIAAASNIMTRAVFPNVPAGVTALGLAATPFRPFLVSTLNSVAMELKYLHRARRNPRIRNAQRLHAACSLIGLACFALEEVAPQLPLVHAAWHCLSSTAVGTVNALLVDVEENELKLLRRQRVVGGGAAGEAGAGGGAARQLQLQ